MTPFFSLSKKTELEKQNIFSVVDIGTDVVKVLVCREEKGKGVVLGLGKQKQRLGDMHNGTIIDIDNVVENCQEALLEAEKMAGISPTDIIIGIAGEWVRGVTSTLQYVRSNPYDQISMTELQNMVHKIQWKAFDDIRKEISVETGYNQLDIKLVHSAVSHVEIDGYKISNPLGFKGEHITMSVFNVFAPLVHFESLTTIASMLNKDLLSIASEPYAVSKCLGFEDGSDYSSIFIDVGGGTTDIAIVINGGIAASKMFGIGGRVFTKRLAKGLNLSFLEAEQQKVKYAQGKLEKKECDKIKKMYEVDMQVWLDGVSLILESLDTVEVLPSKILLCGGGALLPGIIEVLEDTDWYKDLSFARKPKVSFIHPKDVINMSDRTGQIKTLQDVTPLALGNLGVRLTGKENLLAQMLKKAIRIVER